MSDMTASRLGQVNAAGDADALFLKVFSGEVLTAFEETNVMRNLHMLREIQSGKSASFPATWKVNARYHVPGTQVMGQKIKHNERVINVDDKLLADVFIADIDEAKNHYDVRSPYSFEVGASLAREFDANTSQVAVLAARASATVSGGSGGSALDKGSTVATTGSVLAAAAYEAAQTLDEKNIPEGDRFMVVRPAQYYLLVQTDKLLNRDFGGSNGSYVDGDVWKAAGIAIVKSNNLPSTNIAAATDGENNTYYGDFSDTVSAVFHKSAIGTVQLMGMSTQMTGNDFKVMYQGTLMVASYALGHGILRPESAVEITKTS